jgi:hypothetical protein
MFGCWVAFGSAALHLLGHVAGGLQGATDAERQLLQMAASSKFAFPGGAQRSLMDLLNGFGLIFAAQLATMGALGLIIQKRSDDELLMLATARVLTGGGVVLLVISFTHFFIIPTMCIALMTLCFGLASVRGPEGPGH